MKDKKGKAMPLPVNYKFPDPNSDEDIDVCWDWDVLTFLHKAAEYERWAERARGCGRDDLAELYEIKAKEWFSVYKAWENDF